MCLTLCGGQARPVHLGLLDQGLIGEEAKVMWTKNPTMIPEGSHFRKMIETANVVKAEKKKAPRLRKAKKKELKRKRLKKKQKSKKENKDETSTSKKGGLLLSIVTILLIL